MDFCGLTAVLFAYVGILVLVGRLADRYLPNLPKRPISK